MAGVEQVEAAVGEDDRLAGLAAAVNLGEQVFPVEDLGFVGMMVVDQVAEDLLAVSSATPNFSTSSPPATLPSAAASS